LGCQNIFKGLFSGLYVLFIDTKDLAQITLTAVEILRAWAVK
jgi:hypothetical protein